LPILQNYLRSETNVYYHPPSTKPHGTEFLMLRDEMLRFAMEAVHSKRKSQATFEKCANLFDRVAGSSDDQLAFMPQTLKLTLTRENSKLILLACLNLIAKHHEIMYFNQYVIVQWVNQDVRSAKITIDDLHKTEKHIYRLVETFINAPTAQSFVSLALSLPEVEFTKGDEVGNFRSLICEIGQFFSAIQKFSFISISSDSISSAQTLRPHELPNSSQALIAIYASIGIVSTTNSDHHDFKNLIRKSDILNQLKAMRSLLPQKFSNSEIINLTKECIERYSHVVYESILYGKDKGMALSKSRKK
jgi:hypothetical protein